MSEMIDRIAKAIGIESDGTWDMLTPSRQRFHRDVARAAIEALREPTDEMCLAGFEDASFTNRGIWKSMIDAALSPPQAKAVET